MRQNVVQLKVEWAQLIHAITNKTAPHRETTTTKQQQQQNTNKTNKQTKQTNKTTNSPKQEQQTTNNKQQTTKQVKTSPRQVRVQTGLICWMKENASVKASTETMTSRENVKHCKQKMAQKKHQPLSKIAASKCLGRLIPCFLSRTSRLILARRHA
jgi:hypothetical protein